VRISKDELKKEYDRLTALYKRLVDEIHYILKDAIETKGIKIHSLTFRDTKIKSFESIYSKLIRKNIQEKYFDAIEDVSGVRVICLYRSDLGKLEELIHEDFKVVKADTTRTRTEMPFGYASDHYVVKLSDECNGPRYDGLKELKCEIQVRTILMDAWASVSHHLAYKQVTDVPTAVLSDFNALSGLFHVADTHFELFRQASESRRANLMKDAREGAFELFLNQEINLDTLKAYFALKYPTRSWINISEMVSELRKFGYERLNQLDEKIKIAAPVLRDMEKEDHTLSDREMWAADGVIRSVLDLTDDKYFESRILPPDVRTLTVKYRRRLQGT
jgi:ppGpp synthetase/RelA/SpoT-type nucleotidyltranferase